MHWAAPYTLALLHSTQLHACTTRHNEIIIDMQALSRLPEALRLKLARSCGAVTLPPGALACRQGERSDAMYVLLRGACAARVLPPPPSPEDTAAVAAADAVSLVVQQQPAAAPLLRAGGGRRGATWEEAAFTEEERARLAAVRADLEAAKQRVREGYVLYALHCIY